ncbi:hypothetical protein F4809DRAFT_141275 [Biscogniauxia mediterranea]|nr:hypothetical protein F4809DRAFT_141275 [Biscogniauxia mediterranea]
MQLTMAPLDIPAPQGSCVVKLATTDSIPRHHHRGSTRSHTRSQPFDADDLRRRLYVVVAEQEALKEKRRGSRIEAEAKKTRKEQKIITTRSQTDMTVAEDARASTIETSVVVSTETAVKPEIKNKTSFAARMAEAKTAATVTTVLEETPLPSSGDTAAISNMAKLRHSKSRSLQDRLRRKASSNTTIITRVDEAATTTAVDNVSAAPAPTAPYRHVPQEAAIQFVRTATPNNARRDRIQVHTVSQQTALRSHPVLPEALPPSVTGVMAAAVTHEPRQRVLKRAHTDWGQICQRQIPEAEETPTRTATPRAAPVDCTALTSGAVTKIERPGPPQHRHTFPLPFANGGSKSGRQGRYGEVVVEHERFRKNGSLGKRSSCRNQIQRAAVLELPLENPHHDEEARKSSDDFPTLMNIGTEHSIRPHERVDWTQADEEMKTREQEKEEAQKEKEKEKEKKPARKTSILLQKLRRADSLWALKSKIVGSRSKRHNKEKDGSAVISEEQQTGEEESPRSASAWGSRSGSRAQSTPTSSSPPSPRSPSSLKQSFLARFKRS